MSDQQVNRRTIRPARIAEKLGVGLPTVWRYARTDPTFPKLFKLTPAVTVGYEDEVDAWVQSRRAAAMPARTQLRAVQKSSAPNAPLDVGDLLSLLAACRARGLKTLDDLARELQSAKQSGAQTTSKARGKAVKATTAPEQGKGTTETGERPARAALPEVTT